MTTSTMMLLAGFVGGAAGFALGHRKLKRPLVGLAFGAAVAVLAVYLFFPDPATTIAVESPDTFETEVLNADMPVMVDFGADWCPACKQFEPVFEGLAEQYAGKIKFVKVDVDTAPMLAGIYNIRGIPTAILFINGKVDHRWLGARRPAEYRWALDEALKTP